MAPQRTCVLLVGMHRSGTSALARVLNIAGVALPAHVLAANPTNPAGHWEPERLVDLHEQMFAELRTSWSDWRRLDVGDLPPARLAHYKAKIAQLITEEYADAPVFVLKDPRVCRMVPLYREIFRDLGIELRPVLIFRHPLEVAASLARRDGLSVFAAQLCWLRNVLDAEADTRDMRRAVVPYEQLIGDWRAQTAFLAARLGIELPLDGDEQQRQVDAFLRADLRHHDFTRTELDRNPEISDWVREAYAAICVAETDPGRARAMLDEVRAAFDAAVRMVSEKPAELIVQEMSGREQLKARLRQQAERHAREMREAEERLELAQAQIRAAQAETEAVRAAFTGSTSWRVTAPLRKSVSSVRRLPRSGPQLRQVCRSAAYFLWRRLPLGNAARDTTKTVLFSALPFVFRDTAVYRRWQDSRRVRPRNDIWGALGAQEADARYVPHRPDLPPAATPVKLVAFYLPQFHPIPENDRWWGEGFTEWTNVRPAQPLFEGHYQPHVPDELGYYDLRDRDVQRRQIELARQYGIGGFCFYAYWFSGKRLLEKPLDAWLADPGLDFPFCVCWANENWTRRWDGLDREILMRQHHSPDNDIAFISDMAKYLADPRYIRVKDRPLLVVYRPGDLPDAAATARRWRQWCRDNGIGEIHLAYVQAFEKCDPAEYGFDAAIEFPPINSAPADITARFRTEGLGSDFTVYDWVSVAERSEHYEERQYPLYRGVCPGWDNTARRKKNATVFLNNTPRRYRRWLENAVRDTCRHFADPDERLVFVNAWNEWAEGAHLEPDRRNGFAYLAATRAALETAGAPRRRAVVVSHDAHPHGAQMLALAIMKTLRELGYEVTAIVLGEGVLLDDYARVADVHCIRETAADAERLDALLARLRAEGCGLAIANTTVSGSIVPALKDHAFTVVSLVHELPRLLREYGLQSQAEAIAARSDAVVFAAQMVRRKFEEFAGPVAGNALVRPQGMYLPPAPDADRAASIRKGLREKLGLAPDSFVVLGVGYADHRKGLDLFVSACAAAIGRDARIFAVWVGHCDETLLAAQREEIARLGLQDRFVFTGRVTNPGDYYLAGDCLALTSREDPFPSTVMEALDAGRPVVGFSGAGGFEDLLTRGCGVLVPAFDTHAFAAALVELAGDRARAQALASTGREIVRREFRMAPYVNDLISCAGVPRPEVSVVVPNYNYARYLPERLASVVDQSQRPGEIIILDDASTDESIEVIERAMAASPVPWTLVRAEKNSGSPFAQWLKGAEMARGELLWIAEADDIASPRFLEQVRTCFQDTDVVMAYTQSRQIDSHGRETSPDYLDYVADIDPQRWRSAYACDGREEIARALYLKNTVPNVSAAVFRRQAFLETFIACEDEIRGYRNAGDWVFYLRLLEKGKIAFCPQALNAHRRHDGSVTISSFDVDHLAEIVRVQSETIRRFELDEDATAKAREYAQELYERFAIASAERPHFLDHPKLRAAGS